VRIAWNRDFGGLPVDPRVTATIDAQRHVFTALECIVEDASPDFSDADDIFKTWRAWSFELRYGELLKTHRHLMKDTVIWNIEAGESITGPQLARIESQRTALYHRVREFMETYEFMICPVNQVPPFDVTQRYITEINGVQMETYICVPSFGSVCTCLSPQPCRSPGRSRPSRAGSPSPGSRPGGAGQPLARLGEGSRWRGGTQAGGGGATGKVA
jgi:Asp-tRNA(Asn)/Glu-tRNA(Gln) amidotransferase A subunit family amidase